MQRTSTVQPASGTLSSNRTRGTNCGTINTSRTTFLREKFTGNVIKHKDTNHTRGPVRKTTNIQMSSMKKLRFLETQPTQAYALWEAALDAFAAWPDIETQGKWKFPQKLHAWSELWLCIQTQSTTTTIIDWSRCNCGRTSLRSSIRPDEDLSYLMRIRWSWRCIFELRAAPKKFYFFTPTSDIRGKALYCLSRIYNINVGDDSNSHHTCNTRTCWLLLLGGACQMNIP